MVWTGKKIYLNFIRITNYRMLRRKNDEVAFQLHGK